MKRNPNRLFYNLTRLLGKACIWDSAYPQDFWSADVPSTMFLPPGRRWWQHPRSPLLCCQHPPCWTLEDQRLPHRPIQSVHPPCLHLTLVRSQDILKVWSEGSVLGHDLVSEEAEGCPKGPLRLPLLPRPESPHFLPISSGSCVVWGQENGLGSFIRHEVFFFLRSRNIKQAASSPFL